MLLTENQLFGNLVGSDLQARNQQQNNDGYSTQNWVNPNPQQPTASQWSPSAPAPDYGINSNDSEQIQIKPRRWF